MSVYGQFLSNIYDHRRPDAESKHCYSYEAHRNPTLMRQEWEQHLDWIGRNIIGPPKTTETFSAQQLSKMGMIGIYSPKHWSIELRHILRLNQLTLFPK